MQKARLSVPHQEDVLKDTNMVPSARVKQDVMEKGSLLCGPTHKPIGEADVKIISHLEESG